MKVNTGNTKEALALAGGTQIGYVNTSGAITYTATAVTPTTSPAWTVNQWAGKFIIVGAVYGICVSNTATAATVDQWYNPATPTGAAGATPAANTSFAILGGAAPANVMALTNTASFAPAATDTALSGEQTASGLGRKFASFTYTTGTNSYQLAATWTYTGSTLVAITGAATFDVITPSAGVMLHETALASAANVNANGDQATMTQTVTM